MAVHVGMAAAPTQAQVATDTVEGWPWRVDLNSWLWMFSVSGDIGAGPVTADVDASFWDILDKSDSFIAFSGRLEVGYERVAGFVDGSYVKLDVDDASGPLGLGSIDVTAEIGIVDFGMMYRVTAWESAVSARTGSLDVYAGARYFSVEVELEPRRVASRTSDRDWFDPIIGVKVRHPLTKRLHLNAWGDIGGFGVESDLTWSATGVLGYDFELFSLPVTVYGGYRAIGWDYSDGSGRSEFEWDVIVHGPTLGLQIRF